MPFIIDDDPKFTRTVTVKTPEGEAHREESFSATFRTIDVDEAAKFDLTESEGSRRFLEHVVVHIEGLVTREKVPVPYTDAIRDQLLKRPAVISALANTYFSAQAAVEHLA